MNDITHLYSQYSGDRGQEDVYESVWYTHRITDQSIRPRLHSETISQK